MFSTPLICSSIGATTVEATTSALAPGYWPVTLMIGGAISGYCATGRRANATAPRITNTIETTAAKIGRSMKKCEIRMARPQFCGRRLRRRSPAARALLLRRHLLPRPRPHQAVDDDAVVGRKSVLDDAQAVDELRRASHICCARRCRRRRRARICAPARCRSRHPAPAAPRRRASPAPARARTCRA